MNNITRTVLQVAIPLVVLGIGIAAAIALAISREPVPVVEPPKAVPVVRVVTVHPRTWRAKVHATGTVQPATRSEIVAEVGGRVVEVGPNLAEGAFFHQGDVLVRLDPRDYEVALVETRAAVAQAELALELEQAEAESARREWQLMQRPEPPPPLVVREPQLAEARSRLEAARARLEAAGRDVERCVVRAPYDGRVLTKSVDLGQFVARNARLAQVYAIDAAEVRLPVPDAELEFLDLDVTRTNGDRVAEASGPKVELSAEFGGRTHTWQGRVTRTEGQLDPRTRMVQMIARVEEPYSVGEGRTAPLLVNQFVRAEIVGPMFDDVFVLPRSALRGEREVLVVDAENRVHARDVDVLRKERDSVVLHGGLHDGDGVCITPLEVVVEGMEVRVDLVDTTAPDGSVAEDGR